MATGKSFSKVQSREREQKLYIGRGVITGSTGQVTATYGLGSTMVQSGSNGNYFIVLDSVYPSASAQLTVESFTNQGLGVQIVSSSVITGSVDPVTQSPYHTTVAFRFVSGSSFSVATGSANCAVNYTVAVQNTSVPNQ